MTFYPVIILSTIFCVTIFIVIAATFGDPSIPVNQWVNKNANTILIVETVMLLVAAIGAMTVDRVRTLRKLAEQSDANPSTDSSMATEDVG